MDAQNFVFDKCFAKKCPLSYDLTFLGLNVIFEVNFSTKRVPTH